MTSGTRDHAAETARNPRVPDTPGQRAPTMLVFALPSLLALALNLWGITREGSMWRDESVTYQVAHRSIPEIWSLLHHVDAVHGAYYFLMHAVFSIWDGGLWALRLPSVLAISVCAGFVALTGRRLAGNRVGTLSGLTFALIPLVQMYAQEGRSYGLVCAFAGISTYLFVRAVDTPSTRLWTAYSATLVAAVLLHEFAVLCLLSHGITLAMSPISARIRRQWIIAAAVTVAVTLPLVLFSLGQSGQVSWIGMPKPREWLVIGVTTAIGLLCAKVVAGRSEKSERIVTGRFEGSERNPLTLPKLSLPLLIFPTAALLLASLRDPVYLDRYVLFSQIGLALLVAAALDTLTRRVPKPSVGNAKFRETWTLFTFTLLAFMALIPVTLQMRTPESRKDDVAAIAETVRQTSSDGDGILYMPARRREWALSYVKDYAPLKDLALRDSPVESTTLQGTELPAEEIRRNILNSKRIVALMDPKGQPLDQYPEETTKRQTLDQFFTECSRTEVKGAQVVLYARPGHC
ncbi:glycosyltransferase family 39 protein [Streptomyces sp. NPDC091292]|uniref:glycosyltransferase family 39 protein n=1 Tax=Streptomyces sp. NPDC091292 TaxID=3365991 RepID=UPI00382AE033